MKKYLKSHGFSLLQVVVAIGLASGLAVYLTKLNTEQKKVQMTAETNLVFQNFIAEFTANLSKKSVCPTSFENISYDGKKALLKKIFGKNKVILYRDGMKIGNKLTIKKMVLGGYLADDPEIPSVGTADLKVDLERMKNVYGGKVLQKSIKMNLLVDEKFKILNCAPLSSGIQFGPLSLSDNIINNEIKSIEQLKKLRIEDVQKIIENNPQLKKMYEQLKHMQEFQKEVEGNLNE